MNKIDDYLRNGVVFEDICREDPRAAATYLKELQSRLGECAKLLRYVTVAADSPHIDHAALQSCIDLANDFLNANHIVEAPK